MPTVEFHFDFGSPNAYLSHLLIPGIERRTGAKFAYVPILLGGVFKATNNASPMVSFAGVKGKVEYQRLEMARFIKKHKATKFRMNPHFPVNTLQIMRGAAAAEIDGYLMKYVEAVFPAMWENGLKMDDPAIVKSALDAAGLDGARTLARIQDNDVKQKLVANTEATVSLGTFGAPTFFVGTEIFFGKDRLDAVEEEIRAQS